MSSGLFAKSLKKYGITTVFGIVGIPVVEVGEALQNEGIKFIAMRNEQSASYAASVYSYLNNFYQSQEGNDVKTPAVLLVVGGPGLIHALGGIYNSIMNKFPLLVIAGTVDSKEKYKMGFQECDHLSMLTGFDLKFKGTLTDENMDRLIYLSIKNSTLDKPMGVSFLDFPADVIQNNNIEVQDRNENYFSDDNQSLMKDLKIGPDPNQIDLLVNIIENGKKEGLRFLLVVGKGSLNCDIQKIRKFVNTYKIPVLPTPMAKGVIPDADPLIVSSARSLALKTADVIIVAGARLNWILHFGGLNDTNKFKENAKFIQIDNDSNTLGWNNNSGTTYCLLSEIDLAFESISKKLSSDFTFSYNDGLLPDDLLEKIKTNALKLKEKEVITNENKQSLLNYNQIYGILSPIIQKNDKDTILITEGANTMDVARTCFPTDYPLHRLDCGTNATMGIGLGYAIAAKLAVPDNQIIIIQGDSAFGFSGMELETIARYNLGIIIIVMNNSGIYHGNEDYDSNKPFNNKTTDLSYRCRYDEMATGLGVDGYLVENPAKDLAQIFEKARKNAMDNHKSSLLNIIISPGKQGKLEFAWQNKKNAATK